MECTEIMDRLEAYLDGELPSGERRSVSAHLAYCPSCSEALASLSAVEALGRSAYVPDPGEAYWKRLHGDIMRAVDRARAQTAPSPRPRWMWLQPSRLGMAALAATAVLVILVVGRVSRENLTQGGFRVPVTLSESKDVMVDQRDALAPVGVAATEAETPAPTVPSEALAEPERRSQAISQSMMKEEAPSSATAERPGVDGVAAPAKALDLGKRKLAGVALATDSLVLRIQLLEQRAALASDSASIIEIRARQARLHVRRVQAQPSDAARAAAQAFYRLHAAALAAHPDSAWFRTNLAGLPPH